MKLLLKLLIMMLLIFISCKENIKTIKADLSFRSITFTSAYGAKEEQIEKVLNEAKNIVSNYKINDSMLKYENYLLSKKVLRLNELKLLKLPHIFLHFGSDSIMEVHLSEKEFKKIEHFKHVDLKKEKKKITLELEVEKKDSGIFYSDNIINIEKVNGKSRSNI